MDVLVTGEGFLQGCSDYPGDMQCVNPSHWTRRLAIEGNEIQVSSVTLLTHHRSVDLTVFCFVSGGGGCGAIEGHKDKAGVSSNERGGG